MVWGNPTHIRCQKCYEYRKRIFLFSNVHDENYWRMHHPQTLFPPGTTNTYVSLNLLWFPFYFLRIREIRAYYALTMRWNFIQNINTLVFRRPFLIIHTLINLHKRQPTISLFCFCCCFSSFSPIDFYMHFRKIFWEMVRQELP